MKLWSFVEQRIVDLIRIGNEKKRDRKEEDQRNLGGAGSCVIQQYKFLRSMTSMFDCDFI
jgi:hypothetical protein